MKDDLTTDILEGLEDLPEVDTSLYDLDEILAEFSDSPTPPPAQPEEPESPPEPLPEVQPEPVHEPEAAPVQEAAAQPESVPAQAEPSPEETEENIQLTMADIVSGTVDSVLEEQEAERRADARRMRRRQRRSGEDYRTRTRPLPKTPAQEAGDLESGEPSLSEATVRMKRLRGRLRAMAIAASLLTVARWALSLLPEYGVALPYGGELPLLYPTLSLALFAAVLGCSWPVFRRAWQDLRQHHVGWALPVVLGGTVTFLDALTQPLLAGRCAGENLGAISMVALALALWGGCFEARGLSESFRLAALGKPAYVVDTGPDGAVKGPGSEKSFYNRTVSDNLATSWQRILVPVFLAASLVFAALSSFGQRRPQDFLWCLSVILTAGTSLALPLVYGLPYARLAKRLSNSGGAVAGGYGAEQLGRCKEILLGDNDLFPPGSVRLTGEKVIAEDKGKVAAYAGSLAGELGACYAPLMQALMQEEGVHALPLVHFHVHEDGGASASISGETAILGSAATLRKQGVRLPRALEQKEGLYLAIDGQLSAIFGLEAEAREGVSWALHAMKRNGITPLLVLRDGAITLKFMKQKFGTDGGAISLDATARSSLAQPGRAMEPRPNGLLYREGLAPFFEVVAGGKRLARIIRQGSFIALLGSAVGTLLGYYLAFSGAVTLLTPTLLMAFLLLWLIPILLLGWSADHL